MKKNIVVKALIVSLVAVTTFFSMKAYDRYLSDNIFSYDEVVENNEEIRYVLNIENTIHEKERENFFNDLMTQVDALQLNLYQYDFDDKGNQFILAHSQDRDYFEKVLLEEGKIRLEKEFEYSTQAQDPKKKIYTVFPASLTIAEMTFDHPHFYLIGLFDVTGTGNISEKLKTLIAYFNEYYPECRMTYDRLTEHTESPGVIDFNLIVLYIMIAGIIAFVYIDHIFKSVKSITIHKLEGISDFKIYVKFVLIPLFKLIPLILIGNALLYIIFIQRSLSDSIVYILFNLFLNGIWYALVLFFSGMVYICIHYIPFNLIIKNMQPFAFLEKTVLVFRTLLLIACLSTLNQGLSQILFISTINYNLQFNSDHLNHLYEFGTIYFDTNYHQYDGTDNLKIIYDQLMNENEAFAFSLLDGSMKFENEELLIAIVDESYLKKQGIIADNETVKLNTIFIPNEYSKKIDNFDLKELIEVIHGPYYELTEENKPDVVGYENKSIDNFDLNSVIEKPVLNEMILYVPFYYSDYDVKPLIFSYDQTNISAQEYIDQLFAEQGIRKTFDVVNMKDAMVELVNMYNQRSVLPIVNVVLLICLILMVDFIQYLIYEANNEKRLYIECFENIGDKHCFKHNLLPKGLMDLAVIAFMMILYSWTSAIFLAIILITETIGIYGYHRYRKNRKIR